MAGPSKDKAAKGRPIVVPEALLSRLAEMHTAERELAMALPLLAVVAKSKDLKTLLKVHRQETKGHIECLEGVAESLNLQLPAKGCKPMTQLIKEGVGVIAKKWNCPDLDQGLMAVGKKIEEFEIAAYTEICSSCKELGLKHEFAMLNSVLNQEKLANDLLGSLAQGKGPLDEVVRKTVLKKVKGG